MAHRRNQRSGGFTMVEMLTVIGIIMLLLAIGVVGLRYLAKVPEEQQTKVMMENLRSMVNEYENNGGDMRLITNLVGNLSTATAGAPTDFVNPGGGGRSHATVVRTRQIMAILLRVPNNLKIFESLPKDRLEGDQNGAFLLDGWGNPIVFVPGGGMTGVNLESRTRTTDTAISWGRANQTIRSTDYRPFFASAGPDKRFDWGDDNVYSYNK